MTKVFSIRGSNGAGKTWVARRIMDRAEPTFKKKMTLDNGVLINIYKDFVILFHIID